MIREISIHAKSSNNKARTLFITCMSLAFVFVSASMLISLYKGVVSLAGVALLVVAITFYSKYLASEYYYDVMIDSDGRPLFVVRQRIGKRHSTLCRIGLYEIRKIEREDANERKKHQTPAGYKKYSYLPTVDPNFSYRLTAVTAYESAEIVIEISDVMAKLLSDFISEAVRIYSENYDE